MHTEEQEAGSTKTAYPVPEATIASDPFFLFGLAAAIIGVLLFWRRKKSTETAD